VLPQRPGWLTLAAALLCFASLAGWMLAVAALAGPDLQDIGIGAWFGASALSSGIGLSRLRRWALGALGSCAAATIAMTYVAGRFAYGHRATLSRAVQDAAIPLVLLALVWVGARRALRSR